MYVGTHARERPDAPAQIMAATGAVTTYRELDDGSNRFAQLLHDQGLRVGDHYAVFMENHPRYLEACWAGDRSGLYYTTVNSYLTAGEVAYIVNDCGARVLVSSSARHEVAAQLPDLCPDVERFLMVGAPARAVSGELVPGWESYEEAVAAYPAEELPRTPSGWPMFYSSGTTGQPKGILRPLPGVYPDEPHTFEAILRGLYDIDEDTVYLSPAPLYHSAPLGFCLGIQRIGGTVVVMERFDAEQALALIERYHVTHSQWVPTMFSRMLKLPAGTRERYDVSSLRCAIHASAPCPVPVKQSMFDWWGPIVYEYYGGTETNGLTFIRPEEWLAHPGSVGRAILGELHILDDTGRDVPNGESGTIYFADGMDFEYHNDPGKTAEAHDGSGRSTIGDVGYVDDEGYLYLTDRKAFMIISGGVNIYPQEAENVLVTHPAVVDVAVIGVPDDDMGEAVKAVVQLTDGVDPSPTVERELIAFCREHLATYKCPRSVDFEAELPRLPTGKLYKRGLRDRYWTARDEHLEAPGMNFDWVIDVDAHITEPADVWQDRVPAKYRDAAPRLVRDPETEKDMWVVGGGTPLVGVGHSAVAGWPEPFPAAPRNMDEVPRAAWDPQARLDYMDTIGIWAQALYPNVGGFGNQGFLSLGDTDLMLACVRAYNDWLTEWCATDSRRLLPITATPFWDVDACVAEVERCAALGHRGVLFTGEPQHFGLPYLGDHHWDRFYAAAQDAGLPISFHIGSGDFESGFTPDRIQAHGIGPTYVATSVSLFLDNGAQIVDLLLSGVLARFPELRFVSVESGIGFLPFLLEAADYAFGQSAARRERPELELLPSEYFRRQVYGCWFFEERAPTRVIEEIGSENLCFETDYPHPICLYGNVREKIEASVGSQPPEVRRRVLWGNAARLYRVDDPDREPVPVRVA